MNRNAPTLPSAFGKVIRSLSEERRIMKSREFMGRACHPINRRDFLRAGCAACVAATGIASAPARLAGAEAAAGTRVRVIYALHGPRQEGPDWPNKGFDFTPVMDRFGGELTRRCPGIEFLFSQASNAEQAGKIVDGDKDAGIDGYLVFQMNCWNQVVQTVAATGKPVLYADFQFGGSGGFLVYTAGFLRARTPNVGFVASSRIEDLAEAAKCFELTKEGAMPAEFAAATARARVAATPKDFLPECKADRVKTVPIDECVRRMKESKILAFRDESPEPDGNLLGIPVITLPFSELNDAWKAADKDESRAVADRWQKAAAKVEGVDQATLETSAAMYLGMKAILNKHGANAITVNCLGGFYGGHIHAYPCLGFHQLLNEGLIGACECDIRSTATMVALTTLTGGRPGTISDPVIDTSKRQIIYAHCVASNRAFGPDGGANPFEILTHSEDRQGASVRSVLPVGYMTTTIEFDQARKQVLFHRAATVANDPDDRACRTKLCAVPVGDIEKLFCEWDQWGWHRVTCYGDLKEPVYALADALGFKVAEEA